MEHLVIGHPAGSVAGRRTRHASRWFGAALLCGVLAACDTGDGTTIRPPANTLAPALSTVAPAADGSEAGPKPAVFRLAAPWIDGGVIDEVFTCDGAEFSPTLSWSNAPADTVELAIAVVDESVTDGPDPLHWVMTGITPLTTAVAENTVPVGAVQAVNSFGVIGWSGPCPPPGDEPHEYRITIYALNQQLELADGTPARDLLDNVETVAIASTDVVGIYGR